MEIPVMLETIQESLEESLGIPITKVGLATSSDGEYRVLAIDFENHRTVIVRDDEILGASYEDLVLVVGVAYVMAVGV